MTRQTFEIKKMYFFKRSSWIN